MAEQLRAYLEDNGASITGVTLDDFSDTGRGLKAILPLNAGDVILSIPFDLLWTVDAAFKDPDLGPILRQLDKRLPDDEILAIHLLLIRLRDDSNKKRTLHTRVLPTRYTTSVFFGDELDICIGSSFYETTKQLQQQVKNDFARIHETIFSNYPELFSPTKCSLEEYTWALCTVWSRCMDFILPGNKQLRVVAPYADMLNHSLDAKTYHMLDQQTNTLHVVAGKKYDIGDQVFINYGEDITNNRFMQLYGFFPPSYHNYSFDLILTTHHQAEYFQQKWILFNIAGLDITYKTLLTTKTPLPDEVLQYLRIQRLTESELAVVTRPTGVTTVVSMRNEGEVLEALQECLKSLLEGFAISAENLERRIDGGEFVQQSNTWAAVMISIGEQQVLKEALKQIEERLMLVKCGYCHKISEKNKRCGKCRKVVYCGVECQRQHHKNHKVVCIQSQQ